jgi:hypothetical protein
MDFSQAASGGSDEQPLASYIHAEDLDFKVENNLEASL